ncbi:spinster family MFS transporter [Rhodoflexus caldus]|uniref:spinster family MFS transporter n=1 Tax=Rhodoflexus caldus TaxID=2891236 RepID=UPI00202AA964|nr:MFS transporter [Rhodoflexus caldus]
MRIFRHPWVAVGMLMLAYVCSFMDRYVLNLLVEPVKRDLGLSDTAIGLLLGASFALFYATLGVPAGYLADRTNRKNLIAAGITLWSLMTALGGVAQNYWQLFMARMGVGVGEATLSPAAYSLIADWFPKERLASALSVYSVGIYIGSGMAYLAGGKILDWVKDMPPLNLPWGGQIFNWQLVLIAVGLPGLLIAVGVALLAEPPRKYAMPPQSKIPLLHLFVSLFQLLKSQVVFRRLCVASSFFTVVSYAFSSWAPATMMRVWHADLKTTSIFMGLLMMLGAPAGVLLGGYMADNGKNAGQNKTKILIFIITAAALIPVMLALPFLKTTWQGMAAFIPAVLLLSAPVGVTAAFVQHLVPAESRGLASASLLLCQNLLGLGLGPTLVALLTDYYFGKPDAIAQSLSIVSIAMLLVSLTIFTGIAFSNAKHEKQ